jgi:ADP-ribose pyrophosphatase YjhB (NUDIX family)
MHPYQEQGFSREKCAHCGWVHYHNSRPTTAAIISQADKILLSRRAVAPQQGKWDVPGGFLEETENPVAGLEREIKEELGVEIEVGQLIGAFAPTLYRFQGQDYYNLDLFYEAKIVKGKPQPMPGTDVAELSWFSPNNLPEIAFSSVKKAIEVWKKETLL